MKKTDDGKYVSIHALLTECDRRTWRCGCPATSFNPRTPYGVRPDLFLRWRGEYGFNPRTPYGVRQMGPRDCRPDRRVSIHALLTECDIEAEQPVGFVSSFNPRTPYGVRHSVVSAVCSKVAVSIHALLTECDRCFGRNHCIPQSFNPRTPYGVRPKPDNLPG